MAEGRVLFWCSDSPACWRVCAILEHKSLPFESKFVDLPKKEHKSGEVVSLNPRGQVPTFRDGDAVVNESAAIVMYLEDEYRENPLLPADAATRATALQRFFEGVGTDSVFRTFIRAKAGADPPLKDEEGIVESMKAELAFWEKYAGTQKFIAGDELTLADLMVAPLFVAVRRYSATFDAYPNLKKYSDMMKEHPLLVKTAPPQWAQNEPKWNFMSVV